MWRTESKRRRAQELIDGTLAIHRPETMAVIFEAFHKAWQPIAGRYEEKLEAHEAKLKLAQAVLDVSSDRSDDPYLICRLALDLFGLLERETKKA